MRLRQRLVVAMIVLVALGLVAVDVITYRDLHSSLYSRVDDQVTTASRQTAAFVQRAKDRGFVITSGSLDDRISPELYVEILHDDGTVVARPSNTTGRDDPAPRLPTPLPAAESAGTATTAPGPPSHPNSSLVDVAAVGGKGPEYRLQATAVPGGTLVVAASLATVNATLRSLRAIELAVTLGLLAALLVLMTLLVRLGLRPLEDMARQADAIADGDLSRRVEPTGEKGEIPRLGRALNDMLEQIETAFAERTRSEERLRSFLADASHELRTPLTSIRGYAELLQKDALEGGEARDRALSRIEKEAARMGVLVGDLSFLAREGESREPARERVDLAAVAADAVADARTLEPVRRIELSAPREVAVAGDEPRLEQMVHNLVGNALAHTPPGTPVEVAVTSRGETAVLTVRDGGPGMNPEQASRVFDRFYRGDSERLDGGSGLGLFIVATLARTFGGSATVDSKEGEGSVFEVLLPLYGQPPDAGSGPKPSAHRPGSRRR